MGASCSRCKTQFPSNESVNLESNLNPFLITRSINIINRNHHQKLPSLKQINLDLHYHYDHDIQRLEYELESGFDSDSSSLSSSFVVESPFKAKRNASGQTITVVDETYDLIDGKSQIDEIKEEGKRNESKIKSINDLILKTDNQMRASSSVQNSSCRKIPLRVKQIEQQIQSNFSNNIKIVETTLASLQKRKLSQQTENSDQQSQSAERQFRKPPKTQSILKVNGCKSACRQQSNSVSSNSYTQQKKVSFQADQISIQYQ